MSLLGWSEASGDPAGISAADLGAEHDTRLRVEAHGQNDARTGSAHRRYPVQRSRAPEHGQGPRTDQGHDDPLAVPVDDARDVRTAVFRVPPHVRNELE